MKNNKNKNKMSEMTKDSLLMFVITVGLIGAFSLVFAFDTDARNMPTVLLALCLFVSVGAIVAAGASFASIITEEKTQARESARHIASIKRITRENEDMNTARTNRRIVERDAMAQIITDIIDGNITRDELADRFEEETNLPHFRVSHESAYGDMSECYPEDIALACVTLVKNRRDYYAERNAERASKARGY